MVKQMTNGRIDDFNKVNINVTSKYGQLKVDRHLVFI